MMSFTAVGFKYQGVNPSVLKDAKITLEHHPINEHPNAIRVLANGKFVAHISEHLLPGRDGSRIKDPEILPSMVSFLQTKQAHTIECEEVFPSSAKCRIYLAQDTDSQNIIPT
jgi:hypothetical protein